ncbi:MAG: DUF58 domain-containing protein [Anaerolineae bacterium]
MAESVGHSVGQSYVSTIRLDPKPRIAGRAWLLASVLGFLFVQWLINPSKVWHYLFISFALLLAVSYLWARSLAWGVKAARRHSANLVQVGDRLVEDFALVNASLLPAPWLEIRDLSTLPGYSVSVALSLGPQSEERWQAGGMCRQRGQFTLGPWQVRTGDPFGLFEVGGEGGVVADLLVYPPVGHMPEVLLRHGQSSSSRSHTQRSLEQTVTSAGVRQYISGDPPRYIHWPTSLHARELMVKDFDLEPSGDMWIVLDLNKEVQAGQYEESTEEYMVLAAASLAARALQRNQSVGLLGYGADRLFVPPAKGESQYWQVMRALATVRAQGTWSIGRVLEKERWNLGHSASAVVLSSSASTELPVGVETVRWLGVDLSVFIFASGSFGGKDDITALASQLLDMDVRHWIIERGHEILPAKQRERLRRARRLSERWGLRGHLSQ